MASPSKRKSNVGAATSPFKRLKAKVGKRAPQAANYTETSFKAASLHVSNQETSLTTKADVASKQKQQEQQVSLLISGRGRLVSDLVHQLHHPAAAVRVSAAKGVQDIITRNHSVAIAANLSPLLSAIGRTSVDEEEEIRHIGLAALQKLLEQKVEPSSVKPFLPLVLAFFQSALNSLDRGTRRDGLGFLHALAQKVMLPASVVTPILPALVRIWDDKAFQAAATTKASRKKNNKKKKQQQQQPQNTQQSKHKSGRYPLLDCLVSLLIAVPGAGDDKGMERNNMFAETLWPSLSYKHGGRSKNAILALPRRIERRPPPMVKCIQELSSITKAANSPSLMQVEKLTKGSATLIESAAGLFSKLRDTLVELQQTECIETLFLLVRALDLFCHVYGEQLTEQPGLSADETAPLSQLSQELLNLMLEVFPVKRSPENHSSRVDSINGQMCITIVHIALFSESVGASRQPKRSGNWLKSVVDYICDRLNDKSLRRPGNDSSQENTLMVLRSLLNSRHDIVGKVPGLEKKLVKHFSAYFVQDKGGAAGKHSARNGVGEICLDVATIIFSHNDNNILTCYEAYGDEAFDIAGALPDLLLAALDAERSAHLVQLISLLVRKRESTLEEDLEVKMNTFLTRLREKIELLLGEGCDTDKGSSVLESWPPTLQRRVISLIVELQSPTNQSLASLSQICARSNLSVSFGLSSEVATFLVHSIFKIRRTVPMQQFLQFLVDSTGASLLIEGLDIPELTPSLISTFDIGVAEISQCLILCGVERVTPMLGPLFTSLMDKKESGNTNGTILQKRLVFSMLSLFVIDLKKGQSGGKSILELLPDSATELISQSAVDLVETLAAMEDETNMKDSLFAPVLSFLCLVPETMVNLMVFVFAKLDEMNEAIQSKSIHFLLSIIHHPIRPVLSQQNRDSLVKLAKACEDSLNGPLQQQSAELRLAIELCPVHKE